jgi:microcystin degradation protein MlrC
MRIAIAGFMHESNTFVPTTTGREAFHQGSLSRGEELVRVWGEAHHEVGGFLAGGGSFGFEAVPSIMAWATPSGPVEDEVLDEVVGVIVEDCRSGRIDGLLLALHGAMVARSHPDADGEVLRRLRRELGGDLPIVTTLDYHANVSEAMAAASDALVGYQTYPHVDQRACGLRAAELLARTIRGEIRPVTAIARPPMIVNLLGQETDREPLRSVMSVAREAERREGLLSVSVMGGFPYADVAEMGTAVMAVADGDRALARSVADEFAARLWDLRHELDVSCPDAAEAVRMAIDSERRPVVLVDLGDNVGGGTPGDGTQLLAELVRQGARDAVVVLHDPEAVREAYRVGVGGVFERAVGGNSGPLYHGPLPVRGVVRTLHEGRWIEDEARHGGRRLNDQGPTAVVEIPGPIAVVLNTLRTPPFSLGQLTSLGIDAGRQAVLVVKAAVAYKAAYAPIAARVIEVDTPGYTAIDPRRFAYRNVRSPLFPMSG